MSKFCRIGWSMTRSFHTSFSFRKRSSCVLFTPFCFWNSTRVIPPFLHSHSYAMTSRRQCGVSLPALLGPSRCASTPKSGCCGVLVGPPLLPETLTMQRRADFQVLGQVPRLEPFLAAWTLLLPPAPLQVLVVVATVPNFYWLKAARTFRCHVFHWLPPSPHNSQKILRLLENVNFSQC